MREDPRHERLSAGFVRADLDDPPFAPGSFGLVVLLGNSLGFAGSHGDALLASVDQLVAPGGTLVVEIAPGPGERSNYLARLPASTMTRLLAAPVSLLADRTRAEGFRPEPRRHVERDFRRWTATELGQRYRNLGWAVLESCAVAPALGPDAVRVGHVPTGSKSWTHLLELEEELGRDPERTRLAAAVLVAVRRPT